ncbi:cytochrome P450 71A1-like isoform X1 [Iris pallida]|uniref:Cytochrome P450 71A1-like isoform X1 n=1 Tax=Iris pallida TaxID=29817 RepID=A0AAX6HYK6_IRIPA|nr:cytochrome P450 71A1-like isoform X1 [Iris pallida]
MAAIVLLLLSLLPVLFFLFLKEKTKQKPRLNLPPGPKPIPVIGNLHQMSHDLPHKTAYEFSKTYGPIVHIRMGQIPSIVVSTPALAKEILRNQDLVFCSRPPLTVLRKYSFNGCDVAAAPYGEHWRNLRKIFILELLSNRKLPFFRSSRQSEVDQMIDSIRTRPDRDTPVNISDLMVRLSSSIVCRVVFGYKSKGKYGERSGFHDLLEEGNALFDTVFLADYFPRFGWIIDWFTGARLRLERNARQLDKFYNQVIEEHKIRAAAAEKTGGGQDLHDEDFVDVMLRLGKEEGSTITTDHIKGAIMDVLVGGTDTSASTVIWGMAELARNPRVMKKAQEELWSVVGDKGKVEESDLSQLEYLKLVVYETMRLHQQSPIPRESMEQCKVDGYDIPKGTLVFVNAWALARDESSWENALEFRPERFIGSPISHLGNDFQYIPFGAGRRICPGINFGMATVHVALANLLYAFRWELPPGIKEDDIDLDEAPGSVTYKKNPLFLVPRNK